MKIKRDTNNKITYSFHQNPTHSGYYLHFSSHCSMDIKILELISLKMKQLLGSIEIVQIEGTSGYSLKN